MRTSSRIRNIKKKPHRCKVNKNKYSSKDASKSIAMGNRNFNISRSNLEHINEVLRVHKLRHAEGKGSWKLLPKDSCEVYKDRRKRQTENKRTREEDEDVFNDRNKTKFHRKPERKHRKNTPRKSNKTTRKSKQRTQDSSQSSKTSCNSSTTYTSVSEMEYDD